MYQVEIEVANRQKRLQLNGWVGLLSIMHKPYEYVCLFMVSRQKCQT